MLTADFCEGCKVNDLEAIERQGLAVGDVSARRGLAVGDVSAGRGRAVGDLSARRGLGQLQALKYLPIPDSREANPGLRRAGLLQWLHPLGPPPWKR